MRDDEPELEESVKGDEASGGGDQTAEDNFEEVCGEIWKAAATKCKDPLDACLALGTVLAWVAENAGTHADALATVADMIAADTEQSPIELTLDALHQLVDEHPDDPLAKMHLDAVRALSGIGNARERREPRTRREVRVRHRPQRRR